MLILTLAGDMTDIARVTNLNFPSRLIKNALSKNYTNVGES